MTYYVKFIAGDDEVDYFYRTGNGMTLKHVYHDVVKTIREYIRDGADVASAEMYNDDRGECLCYVIRNAGGDMETNRF